MPMQPPPPKFMPLPYQPPNNTSWQPGWGYPPATGPMHPPHLHHGNTWQGLWGHPMASMYPAPPPFQQVGIQPSNHHVPPFGGNISSGHGGGMQPSAGSSGPHVPPFGGNISSGHGGGMQPSAGASGHQVPPSCGNISSGQGGGRGMQPSVESSVHQVPPSDGNISSGQGGGMQPSVETSVHQVPPSGGNISSGQGGGRGMQPSVETSVHQVPPSGGNISSGQGGGMQPSVETSVHQVPPSGGNISSGISSGQEGGGYQAPSSWTRASGTGTTPTEMTTSGGMSMAGSISFPRNGTALSGGSMPCSVGSINSAEVYRQRWLQGRALNAQREAYWMRQPEWIRATPPMASGMTTPPMSNHFGHAPSSYAFPSNRVQGYYVPEWSEFVTHTPSFSADSHGPYFFESPSSSFSELSASQAQLEDVIAYSQARVDAYASMAASNGL